MKIAVFGANGQLGRKFQDWNREHSGEHDFVFTDIDTLDITCKRQIEDFMQKHRPQAMINCAAYTAVDKAEDEPESAGKINHAAVELLSEAACAHHAFMVHVSTDYVFDGTQCRPYVESDATSPVSVYGNTKLKGEQAMQKSGCCGVIIRTAWLYSEYGNNFVKTMLRLGHEKTQINVVCDQVGTPTYAGDLAEVIMQILNIRHSIKGVECYHFSNEGAISWYDFSQAIMSGARLDCKVMPILGKDYPAKAHRPYYSVLDKSKIKQRLSIEIPYWKHSLDKCIRILSAE
ncbi:MAG: dTDP-4-dehydrorhamnose reductase [Bacteroidales bacterium]|nr:dTDP-4-dehydrorhamnose reductase [Bacteroidales bacterium]